MFNLPGYTLYPLGDTAITIDFGNHIDKRINEIVLSLHAHISAQPFNGFIEAVPAYSSLTVHYDPWLLRNEARWGITISELVAEKVEALIMHAEKANTTASRQINVPVCYALPYAIDMEDVCAIKKITKETIIHLHTSQPYRVYMLGFLPGFAYMGEIDEELQMPRKPVPQNIPPGSVGITGRQTGIYPLQSPGGWNIIGRTPVTLFQSTDDTVQTYFQPGDIVRFYSITSHEFENY
jgi:inhibitor of KinA